MRIISKIVLLFLTCITISSPASADDNEALCSFYGTIGGVISEFMLPLTVQEFVDMSNGRNAKLEEKMTESMLDAITGTEMVALTKLNEQNIELLSQAAGQASISLLMSGQAANSEGVVTIMHNSCLKVSAKKIIKNQRKASAAIDANLGK